VPERRSPYARGGGNLVQADPLEAFGGDQSDEGLHDLSPPLVGNGGPANPRAGGAASAAHRGAC
jgi:hypothetical protein